METYVDTTSCISIAVVVTRTDRPTPTFENVPAVTEPMIELNAPLRWAAFGGVIGPIVFIAGWAMLGFEMPSYSVRSDPISELARSGVRTSSMMTLVFVFYGVSVAAYAMALRRWLAGRSWMAAAVNGVAALGVAATPLGSFSGDVAHAGFALLAYVALALLPFLASGELTGRARTRSKGISLFVGALLLLSLVGPDETRGLFQRAGLTLGDVWIVISAIAMIAPRSKRLPS